MDTRRVRTFQALILALSGFYLIEQVWSGRILFYINQRFVLLVLLAGIALIGLAQVALQERKRGQPGQAGHEHEHGGSPVSMASLAWMVIPLALGVLVPVRDLGTSALPNRGIQVNSPFTLQSSINASALERLPGQRTVLDWIRAFQAESNPHTLDGEGADVIGFVYHDPRLSADQFLVGRYTVACCIADAAAIGISVNWEQASSLADNQWVRVQGTIATGELEGQAVPVINADQILPIPMPDQPYLFP